MRLRFAGTVTKLPRKLIDIYADYEKSEMFGCHSYGIADVGISVRYTHPDWGEDSYNLFDSSTGISKEKKKVIKEWLFNAMEESMRDAVVLIGTGLPGIAEQAEGYYTHEFFKYLEQSGKYTLAEGPVVTNPNSGNQVQGWVATRKP
jgi:hypothetical protein